MAVHGPSMGHGGTYTAPRHSWAQRTRFTRVSKTLSTYCDSRAVIRTWGRARTLERDASIRDWIRMGPTRVFRLGSTAPGKAAFIDSLTN